MIWNTADPITTKTNRACNREKSYKCSLEEKNLYTYNQFRADGVFIIRFGGFGDIPPLGNIFSIFLVRFSHLRCARHGEVLALVCVSWVTTIYWCVVRLLSWNCC